MVALTVTLSFIFKGAEILFYPRDQFDQPVTKTESLDDLLKWHDETRFAESHKQPSVRCNPQSGMPTLR